MTAHPFCFIKIMKKSKLWRGFKLNLSSICGTDSLRPMFKNVYFENGYMYATLKTILPYLIIGILIVIALFYFKGCHDNPQVNTKPDTTILNDFLNRKGIEFKKLISDNKTLNDSLKTAKKTKIKIVYRTKTVYDSLLVTDTSCVNSLVMLYNECQKNDSINDVIIDNLSTQNANLITATNNQQDVIDMQKYKIKSDSIFIKDEFPKEYKRGLKKGRKQGIIIGTAIETAVIVGGLILVK